ncbi:hypothetical protein EVAR_80592_1 [Eumeta japonica]|uniref:Uncharacterized protein n=1 Tax=Eumeta variegata TaxID=151549 RepID=A0A4C1TLN9_EUMVA|nr:hypothetical protein EVAR_80592_1 [Eumeta japonica]
MNTRHNRRYRKCHLSLDLSHAGAVYFSPFGGVRAEAGSLVVHIGERNFLLTPQPSHHHKDRKTWSALRNKTAPHLVQIASKHRYFPRQFLTVSAATFTRFNVLKNCEKKSPDEISEGAQGLSVPTFHTTYFYHCTTTNIPIWFTNSPTVSAESNFAADHVLFTSAGAEHLIVYDKKFRCAPMCRGAVYPRRKFIGSGPAAVVGRRRGRCDFVAATTVVVNRYIGIDTSR